MLGVIHNQLLLVAGAIFKVVPAGCRRYQSVDGSFDDVNGLLEPTSGFRQFSFFLQRCQL